MAILGDQNNGNRTVIADEPQIPVLFNFSNGNLQNLLNEINEELIETTGNLLIEAKPRDNFLFDCKIPNEVKKLMTLAFKISKMSEELTNNINAKAGGLRDKIRNLDNGIQSEDDFLKMLAKVDEISDEAHDAEHQIEECKTKSNLLVNLAYEILLDSIGRRCNSKQVRIRRNWTVVEEYDNSREDMENFLKSLIGLPVTSPSPKKDEQIN